VNRRILVVDDKKTWRDTLRLLLKTEDRDIFVAESKEEAAEMLRRRVFDVIVVDLRMNEMDESNTDGLTLLQTIRTEYPNEPMEAIVLTGHGTVPATRDAFKKYEVYDFIEKSQECGEELEGSVQEALARKEHSEKWRLYATLIESPLGERIVTALMAQLLPPDWSREKAANRVNSILVKVLLDDYLPLSVDIFGPELLVPSPPTSQMVLWSRAKNVALAVVIQQGGLGTSRSHSLLKVDDRWNPELKVKPTYDPPLSGALFELKNMTFEGFYDLIEGAKQNS
jgi:CheY-like chemotaxis protein